VRSSSILHLYPKQAKDSTKKAGRPTTHSHTHTYTYSGIWGRFDFK